MIEIRHGGQIEALAKQAGVSPSELLDLSASIHPYGFPEWTRSLISSELESLIHYPDQTMLELKNSASKRYGCETSEIACGNGSSELLDLLARSLTQTRLLLPVPAYGEYRRAFQQTGWEIVDCPCFDETLLKHDWKLLFDSIREHDVVILGHPINPTGLALELEIILEVINKNPTSIFIIDEAFADYLEDNARLCFNRPDNVIVLCSLTKFYAVPGLRIGLMLAGPNVISACEALQTPWSVNHLAQKFGIKALSDSAYLDEQRNKTKQLKEEFEEAMKRYPECKLIHSDANFYMLKVPTPETFSKVMLGEHKIAVRLCDNFEGLKQTYIRIGLPNKENQTRWFKALDAYLKKQDEPKSTKPLRLMIQGTASNAGKSMIVAALCRIFTRRGLKVAPFKSQNMSLNSCVCRDGLEIARAQLLQSMACKRLPEPEMNPILLKPDGPGRSQVVMLGESLGSMSVAEYHGRYKEFLKCSLQSYDALAKKVDLVIMEGAGSISEINLRSVDLVNMPFAEATQTPVVLLGNIDLGGVYGSLVGSMELLTESERKLIKGFVINKFHGEAKLLKPAHDQVSERTGKPFLGVVPYLNDLNLPEEDSVAFSNPKWGKHNHGECLDIVVVDVGYASNVNDFEALMLEEDVQLRKVTQVSQLGDPDVIILPGSKNVFLSFKQLQERGFVDALKESKYLELLGICGGLAILSKEMNDPEGVEAEPQTSVAACAQLELKIELNPSKKLTQQKVTWHEFNIEAEVYEMHNGRVYEAHEKVIANDAHGNALAWRSQSDSRLWGTWCHGLFDDDTFRRAWLNHLRVKKGMEPLANQNNYSLEAELDRLADHVEAHCDIDALWDMIVASR